MHVTCVFNAIKMVNNASILDQSEIKIPWPFYIEKYEIVIQKFTWLNSFKIIPQVIFT